ncbi:hypothetical protein ACFY1V_31650 [Streptomyces sp. NPDC001255]|uniref:hypothetical protein n=1 Tax=Streptomyces sp. NPDC001255 TaxID=3364550 RepID=UPI0036792596
MYRLIRGSRLAALETAAAEQDESAAEIARLHATTTKLEQDARRTDNAFDAQLRTQAEAIAERLEAVRERDAARAERDQLGAERTQLVAEAEQLREELAAARAQVLLDAEDRVALRALLRTARRQENRANRVYVLFRYGALHSVHATNDAAEEAAEAEGAERSGWTSPAPGAALPSATEISWRIQPLPLGTSRA